MIMKKSLNIWVLQTGEPLHCDGGNPRPMRAMNLADAAVRHGHRVTIVSSAFNHTEKLHRATTFRSIEIKEGLRICLIPSPGYQSHKGLARLYDHAVLAFNLKKWLGGEAVKPDVVFIGYPPIEVAFVMAGWLVRKSIPFVVDVKDQWPHIFVDSMPPSLKPVARLLFAPYFFIGSRTLKKATSISAMADDFLEWSIKFSGRDRVVMDRVFPLTAPRPPLSAEQRAEAQQFWAGKDVSLDADKVVFAGTITGSFDIRPVVKAAQYFFDQGSSGSGIGCEFVICGDGPHLEEWRGLFKGLENVHFPGWVTSAQAEVLFESAVASLVPLKSIPNYTGNVPNKVVDSLARGKPVLSGLRGTLEKMIVNDGVGLFYGDDQSLSACITKLLQNPELTAAIGSNCRRIYDERYDFEKVYDSIVSHLVCLDQEGN